MLSNDYNKLMQPLRNREVQPAFEDIRSMVLSQKRSRRFLPIPFWLYLSASAPMLLAAAILFFPEWFGLQRVPANSLPDTLIQTVEALPGHSPSLVNNPSVITGDALPLSVDIKHHMMGEDRHATSDERQAATLERKEEGHELTTTKADPQPSADQSPSSATNSEQSSVHEEQPVASEAKNDHPLSLFISAGLPPVQSSLVFTDRLYGSIGIRYDLTPASSVIIELRKNAFIKKYNAQKIVYHDTILTVGNQSYNSTIGELSSFRAESANNILSLGVGYRLALMSSGAFTPFIEALFGVASQGGIVSELAGIQYSFSTPFSFEFALRTDQLLSKGSASQAAFNLNAGLNFSW